MNHTRSRTQPRADIHSYRSGVQTANAFERPEVHPKRPTDIAAPIDATTGKTALLPGLDATPVVAPKKPSKV